MPGDLESRFSGGMSIDRGPLQAYEAYDETAFHHFMAIESRRAQRAGRPLVLLLVEFEPDGEGHRRITPAIASRLFAELTACVREVDFMGWYSAGDRIGAVLTPGGVEPTAEISQRIGDRVGAALNERLPWAVGRRLSVRVVELPSSAGAEHG